MKSKILFVIFLISVAAMDSEHIIFVGAMCLISILLLYRESCKESHKKKEPAATDSIKNNLHNCIIKQGKENAMEKCKVCGGNCDNGELTGGICPECREEEKVRQIRADEMTRRMNSPYHQMELEGV